MIASLRTIAPDVGAEALALVETPGPVSPQALLTGLLNDLAGVGRELVLVIDDYHVIETRAVHEGLGVPDRQHATERPPGAGEPG